jgi:hypothetical protein
MLYSLRLPPDDTVRLMAAAVLARGGVEDRRDIDPAPPTRRLAAAGATPPETELGGPGHARRPAQRDTESAPPRAAAPGHPGNDPALAPRNHPPPLGDQVHARQDRPASQPPAGLSGPWFSGWPGRTPNGATAGSVSVWGSDSGWIAVRIWCWWVGLTLAGSGRFGVPCRGLVVPVAGTGPGSPCWLDQKHVRAAARDSSQICRPVAPSRPGNS